MKACSVTGSLILAFKPHAEEYSKPLSIKLEKANLLWDTPPPLNYPQYSSLVLYMTLAAPLSTRPRETHGRAMGLRSCMFECELVSKELLEFAWVGLTYPNQTARPNFPLRDSQLG